MIATRCAAVTAARWFERGPYRSSTHGFCGVNTTGTANYFYAAYTYGLRPDLLAI